VCVFSFFLSNVLFLFNSLFPTISFRSFLPCIEIERAKYIVVVIYIFMFLFLLSLCSFSGVDDDFANINSSLHVLRHIDLFGQVRDRYLKSALDIT
jgi:hypothetical protein